MMLILGLKDKMCISSEMTLRALLSRGQIIDLEIGIQYWYTLKDL